MKKSISELQDVLKNEFEHALASPTNSTDMDILRRRIPDGYRLTVTLRQNGKKKRRDASAESWSPESGEIVLGWAADRGKDTTGRSSIPSREAGASPGPLIAAPVHAAPEQVRELCGVLGEVERAGRSFIALKWFRDDVLAGKNFSWAQSAEGRQAVLAKAIEQGAVITKKIPNPRAPQFPTTTLTLSRSHFGTQPPESRRYAPVAVKGEPLSATLLRDRGTR
ncbi:MAG: hypothetical protein WA700_19785 [Acidobacteriaceae bacterium]